MYIEVQLYSGDKLTEMSYTYECPYRVKVGDNVRVPVRRTTCVGRVIEVDIPEEELRWPINEIRSVLSVSQSVRKDPPETEASAPEEKTAPVEKKAEPEGQLRLEDLPEEPEKEAPQENTALIVVKQLPIIEQRLYTMKEEIGKTVSEALALACTEETVKAVKAVRADLNKKFKDLEDQRKEVKNTILAPYTAFEKIYEDCVTNLFGPADRQLKEKIDGVENGIRERKTETLRSYFEEYRKSLGLDPELADFDSCGIRANLSSSDKALRTQAQMFIDIVAQDVKAISDMECSEEILVEYKKTHRLAEAVTTVKDRHARIEEEKKRRELMAQEEQRRREAEEAALAAAREAAPVAELPPEILPAAEAPEEEPDLPYVEFRVYGTIDQLRALKKFMNDGGYRYEQL